VPADDARFSILGYCRGVTAPRDGTPPAEADVGRLVGERYLLGELVGIGGMATVHRALDTRFDRSVAVKLLRREIIEDVDIAMRFRREALAATVLRHPNIVACLEAGTDDGQPYLVMELVEGEDLAARLRRVGRVDPPEAARIALDVARGLGVAHVRGIVHRDVKPGNILLARDGRAMVTDFGIARLAADAEGAVPGTTLGSVQYFSPEQARGATTTAASDVYGVGLVLYEAMTGRRAWRAETTAALASVRIGAPAPSPRALRPEIPAALDGIVIRALDPEPSLRFPNGAALAAALEGAIGRPEPVSPRVTAAGGTQIAAAAGVGSLAAMGAGAVPGASAPAGTSIGAGAVDGARSTPTWARGLPARPIAVGASSAAFASAAVSSGAPPEPASVGALAAPPAPASVGGLAAPMRPSNGAPPASAAVASHPQASAAPAAFPQPQGAGRTVAPQPRAARRPPPAVAAPLVVLLMVIIIVGGALYIAALPPGGDAGNLAVASPSSQPTPSPTVTPRATAKPTATPKPAATPAPAAAATPRPASGPGSPDLCGPIFGLACALDAGRYAPAVFEPAVRFDLRDGWSTQSQGAELLVLGRRAGTLTFASGIDTVYPKGDPAKAPATARALTETFITTDGVASGDPSDRKVDKRRAKVVDVWPSGRGRLPLFGAGAQVYFLEASGPTRVVVVDAPGGVLILTVEASDSSDLEDIWPEAKRVIDSLRFR
jgi:hypothetical protein